MWGLENSDVLFTNFNHIEFREPKSFTCNVFWGRLIHFLHCLILKTLLCHPCFSRLRHFAAQFSKSLHNKQREKGQGFPKNVTCTKFRATKMVKIRQKYDKTKREKRIKRIQKNVSSFSISNRKYSE